ncbi:MAG: NADH-quinone oxidoreductase subunit NuoN [Alphaproteobacteria bacterium]
MSGLGDITMKSLHSTMPELFLCVSAIILLMYGVYCRAKADGMNQILALAVLALTMCFVVNNCAEPQTVMNGMFITDAFACFGKVLILGAGILVLLFSSGWLREEGGRPFEFIILMLFATLGMMFMVSAADFLTLYIGLEMASLSLYVLASFQRDHAKSSEAGLKYFVLGALASGMLLFGISLVYGFTGTTSFDSLSALFGAGGEISKATIVGLIFIMVGFCFKLSAAPFHMWAPDVYEGAPTPVTAFFATAPKIAAFALFTRVLMQPFGELLSQWQQVVIFAAIASMLVGALAAIMQTNIKRLLAYSSIGHVGFIFMAIAAGSTEGVQAMLVYLALYIFMSAGAFGCVLAMRRGGEPVEDIKSLAGLSQTQPFMAALLAVFMFSMAGIPPLAGFFGKMYVVLAAVKADLIWLAVLGVATSVIACYYYLKVVKVMYFDTPAKHFDADAPFAFRAAMIAAVLVTALFFLMPTPLVTGAKAAADSLFVVAP